MFEKNGHEIQITSDELELKEVSLEETAANNSDLD